MLIGLVVFLLIVVVFAVQNAQMVPINFIVWSFSSNQALIVLGSAAIGLLIGALWSWLKGASQRRLLKETSKSLDEAQKRIISLENSLSEEIAKSRALKDQMGSAPKGLNGLSLSDREVKEEPNSYGKG